MISAPHPPCSALPSPARRRRSISSIAALGVALAALAGCACPDVGYIDSLALQLDQAPPADADWQLVVTETGEPPCTLELLPDEVREVQDGACPFSIHSTRVEHGGGYRVVINSFTPDRLRVVLRIDGVEVVERLVEPTYETRNPDGPFCGGALASSVRIDVPPTDG